MALGFFWIGGAVGLMAGSAWIAWTRNGLPVEDARLEEIRAMERWSEDAADDLAAARRAGSEPGLHLDHA
jgi:hypothetical protein